MTEGQTPADPTPLMRRATALHRRGKLDAAETLYRQVLAGAPDNAHVLHQLGVLEGQRTNYRNAVELIGKSLAIDPSDAAAHYSYGNLMRALNERENALASYDRALALRPDHPGTLVNRGIVLYDLGRYDEALRSYDSGLALDPSDASGHFNRGNVLFVLKRHKEALTSYRHAIALTPKSPEPYQACGDVLAALGRRQEALVSFERALAIRTERRHDDEKSAPDLAAMQRSLADLMMGAGDTDKAARHFEAVTKLNPEDETARYFLAAMTKDDPPDALPGSYVVNLFDAYASKFDHLLVNVLGYRGPELLANAVLKELGTKPPALSIVDLGCGTGLCGPLFKAAASRLVGVDLSEKMLAKARERGVYDELVCGELVTSLTKWNAQFDLAIAADVFIYVGNLEPALKACARALKPGGLLAFTVEEHGGTGFRLDATSRFSHSKSYLEAIARAEGYAMLCCDEVTIRYNLNVPVAGLLTILRNG